MSFKCGLVQAAAIYAADVGSSVITRSIYAGGMSRCEANRKNRSMYSADIVEASSLEYGEQCVWKLHYILASAIYNASQQADNRQISTKKLVHPCSQQSSPITAREPERLSNATVVIPLHPSPCFHHAIRLSEPNVQLNRTKRLRRHYSSSQVPLFKLHLQTSWVERSSRRHTAFPGLVHLPL